MITVKKYDFIPIDANEILRYARCPKATAEILLLLKECLKECEDCFSFRVCYDIYDIKKSDNTVTFPFYKSESRDLLKVLKKSSKAIVFAATIGLGIDRLITKYSKILPSKALMFQAIGTAYTESLCDVFEAEMRKNFTLTKRFSPGYGDLPLSMQENIFKILACPKNIGVSLTQSLLMSPSKSVTAIIGIGENK